MSSQMHSNVIQPLLALKKEQSTNREHLVAEVTRLDKGLERGRSDLLKAKTRYFKLCKDYETNTANLQKAEKDPTTMKPKELIKLRTTVQTLKKDSEQAHAQYQQNIKDFQAYQKKYEEGIRKVLQEFQAMEEKRMQKLKEAEEKMCQGFEALVANLQQAAQALRKSVEAMDYASDIQGFIIANKTGLVPEAPVEYEPYISQLTGQPAHQADKIVNFSSSAPSKKNKKTTGLKIIGKKSKKKKDDTPPVSPVPHVQQSNARDRSESDDTSHSKENHHASLETKPLGDHNTKSMIRAKALYDYIAADDTEISFKTDDIITVTRNDDSIPGWLEGELNGKRGLFPGNYVEILNKNRKCVVLFDFIAENGDELTIKEGEELIIESENEGWCTGRNKDGKTGLFPRNYVEER
eukprot:TRINITY_DN3333_c0_g3_i1.p1 TRINITY_DN3333_c0_g3~~TRINITY_DN3333_c0_g3_i1.p1  ORF type:complete len:469 (-),score=109.87 TRINITY_DN3333_c0_g3_i1:130-1353(-)